jgi:orotidine-5'-phosphate decarboxylase
MSKMEKIIIPLDGFESDEEIMNVVFDIQEAETLLGEKIIWGFKVNDALIKYGCRIVEKLKMEGFRVFADPKLYDIPNTMFNSLESLIKAGADIISLHCSARYTPFKEVAPKVAGITILTSMDEGTCEFVYGGKPEAPIERMVNKFAIFARECNYGYLVCSAKDLSFMPNMQGTKLITPGIRPRWYQETDDQKRVLTPREAINAGADLLVIGRPILKAENRVEAIIKTNKEIEGY